MMSKCDAGRFGGSRAGDVAAGVVGILLLGLVALVAIGISRWLAMSQ